VFLQLFVPVLVHQPTIFVIPFDAGIQFEELRIPSWFKNTSQWWVEGMITEQEYVSATEYLIGKHIIRV